MDRRKFLKLSGIASVSILTVPTIISATSYHHNFPIYSKVELMGKGQVPLTGKAYRLRKEAGDAFMKMRAEALKVGIDMYSQSSFRSYDRQNGIWTRKYNRFVGQGLAPKQAINKIIQYSTVPGTSRHHWGTDLDIIDRSKPIPSDPLLARHSQKGGVYEKMYNWLQEHSERFGFYEVYNDNHDTRKGFHYEPWHYSYKPLSQEMLRQYLQIDLKAELKKYHLKGIDHFTDEFLEKYIKENVKGINPALLLK